MPIQNAGTGNDVRGRAAAILSGHKLRMLEGADITVVEKQRLEALERLYGATVRRNNALESQMTLAFRPDDPDADREFISAEKAFYQADDDIDEILEQLEEMGGVGNQPGS